MLPFLKKKSDADAPQVAPWHPNFRNYEKLPDVKAVRTAFFVNGAAIAVALSLLTYFGFKEWQLRVLVGQIAEAERQSARDKPGSDQAVVLFKKFQVEETKIKEVETFVKSKPSVSEMILHLGRTLPKNIALDTVELRDNGLVVRISVRGSDEAAPGLATAYVDQLKADKFLTQRFEPAEMTSIALNPATAKWAAEIDNRLKGTKK